MDQTFNIVFAGQFAPGVERADVLPAFARRFNVSEEKAAAMLPASGTTLLKRNVDRATGERFQQVLADLGVVVSLQPATAAEAPAPEDDPQAFNPYQRVSRRQPSPDPDLGEGDGGGEIVSQSVFEGAMSVPPGRGWKWISEGYSSHVKKDLGAWVGAVLVYFVISVVLSMVPFIGSVALLLLGPVIMAGFMIGARDQSQGGAFTFNHLFSAFDESPGQLMLVAVLYFVGALLVGVVTVSMFGASMMGALAGESAAPPSLATMLLPLLVMMLLLLPLLMAYWFAPALVALNGLSAVEAMKQSFRGCLKNMLPMLLYGLIAALLIFVAAIPLLLGLIIVMPVMVASIYVAYADIFQSSDTTFTP